MSCRSIQKRTSHHGARTLHCSCLHASVFAHCMFPCMHASVFAPCTVPVCMHMCSHIACFMYACICVRTLHVSCLNCPSPSLALAPCIQYGSELTIHTHKSIKGSMGASSHTIWERTHQTTLEDDMDTVLFVCLICLFVFLVFV